MKRIKMLTTQCGPGGSWDAGASRNVPDDVAKTLIDGKYAIEIEDLGDGIETAAVEGGSENAARRAPGPKGRATNRKR